MVILEFIVLLLVWSFVFFGFPILFNVWEFKDRLKRYNKRNPEEYRVPIPKGIVKTIKMRNKYYAFIDDKHISDFFCPIVDMQYSGENYVE